MNETTTSMAVAIEEWRPDLADAAAVARDVDMLAGVLHAVVHGGAGVSFIVPFSLDDARAFWTEAVLPGVTARRRRVLVARARRPHRRDGAARSGVGAEPAAPRRGAEAAGPPGCAAARDRAIADGRARGAGARQRLDAADAGHVDGQAGERLYRSLGYTAIGSIPRFARGSTTPELEPATIMYKELDQSTGARQPPTPNSQEILLTGVGSFSWTSDRAQNAPRSSRWDVHIAGRAATHGGALTDDERGELGRPGARSSRQVRSMPSYLLRARSRTTVAISSCRSTGLDRWAS